MIFFLLKIKLKGFFNFGFRLKKKYTFDVGFINFLFFLMLMRNFGILYKFFFLKKNVKNSVFIKSNIRYKVSKHSVSRVSNRFVLEIFFNNNIYSDDQVSLSQNITLLSSCFVNTNHSSITFSIKNSNFFIFFLFKLENKNFFFKKKNKNRCIFFNYLAFVLLRKKTINNSYNNFIKKKKKLNYTWLRA